LTALWISCATAQSRRAAIQVNVTVLDAAASDVLGAHAIAPAPSDAPAGGRDAWRITAGRAPELSLQAERVEPRHAVGQGPSVAICETDRDVAATCRDRRLPVLQLSGGFGVSGLVVRFRRDAGPDAGTPVRLTLAYTGT
jgi:hypothetical protein